MKNKILIVSTEFPPMPGGIGNHAYNLAKELDHTGYQVTVLTEKRESKNGDWDKLLESNNKLRIFGIVRNRIIFVTYLKRLWKFLQLIRQDSFRAVIFSGKFAVWLCAVVAKENSIIVIHGTEIKQKGLLKSVFEKGLKNAQRIICVSNYTKEQLLKEYSFLDKEKVVVINNGFRTKNRNGIALKKKTPDNSLNLVTVGGIHRRKGQFNVVKALPDLLKVYPELNYHVIGLPVEKESLLELVSKLRLNGKVCFHHNLSDTEVEEFLMRSDIFCMLSEHLDNGDFEGFGIAIIEAMSFGLPAVGSKKSGIADAICNDYSGKVVDPHNSFEFVEAVSGIVADYDRFSANARKWSEKFNWSVKVKEYCEIIEKL